MTHKQAAEHFKTPRSTIKNKLNHLFSSTPRHPKGFTDEEELAFASHMGKMCEFGFPIDELNLRYNVCYETRKDYYIYLFFVTICLAVTGPNLS